MLSKKPHSRLRVFAGKAFRLILRPILFSRIISDSCFVILFNKVLWLRGTSDRVKKVNLPKFDPQYQIESCDLKAVKYFCYRQQGYASFSQGIYARGESIGHTYLLQHIDFDDGDIVIDCGANTGDLRIFFENRGLDIAYFGIEPGTIEFQALQRNNPKEKGNSVYNCALAEEIGQAKFYYKPEFGDSSLIENSGFDAIHNVDVWTLDFFVGQQGLTDKRIKLLKLEAEGAEPEVCAGALGVIEKIDYIAADLGFERGVKSESSAPQVINFLAGHGFEIVDVASSRLCVLFRNTKTVGREDIL